MVIFIFSKIRIEYFVGSFHSETQFLILVWPITLVQLSFSPDDVIQLKHHFYTDCSQSLDHELRPTLQSSSQIPACPSNTTKQTYSKTNSSSSSIKLVLPSNYSVSINGIPVLLGRNLSCHWPLPLFHLSLPSILKFHWDSLLDPFPKYQFHLSSLTVNFFYPHCLHSGSSSCFFSPGLLQSLLWGKENFTTRWICI